MSILDEDYPQNTKIDTNLYIEGHCYKPKSRNPFKIIIAFLMGITGYLLYLLVTHAR